MKTSALEDLYSNTCAICWTAPDFDWSTINFDDIQAPPWPGHGIPVTVVGTGFLVAPRIVMTAAHVIAGVRKLGITFEQIALVFTVTARGPATKSIIQVQHSNVHTYTIDAIKYDGTRIPASKPRPDTDFAFLTIPKPIDAQDLPAPTGLKFADPRTVTVGDPVTTAGYFLGQKLVAMRGNATMRFGPLVFSGGLAAVFPVGIRWTNNCLDYYVNVTGGAGMSGAPVVSDVGEVIGMITGGVETPVGDPNTGRVSIPRNLARVMPLYDGNISRHYQVIERIMLKQDLEA